jgi:hypothetical protein
LVGLVAHANNYFLLFDYALTPAELKRNNISFDSSNLEVVKKYNNLSTEKGNNLFVKMKDDIINCFLRNEKDFKIVEEKTDFISSKSDKVIISLNKIEKSNKTFEITLKVKLIN